MAPVQPGTKLYPSPCVKPMAKAMTLIISSLPVEQLCDCYFTLMATTCFLIIEMKPQLGSQWWAVRVLSLCLSDSLLILHQD